MTESQPTRIRPSPFRPVIFIFILFVATAAVVGISKWYTPPELVPWKSDFPAAQAESRATSKPILLYFTAEWCGPCQSMRRYVWTDSQVAAAASAYIPVRIDVDRQPELAHQYRAEEGIPLFVVMDPAGKMVRRFVGAMEAEQMIAWLRSSH